VGELRLVDRDYKIIREIDRWRVCQGKHIKELAGFDGQRACDRRLRKLIEAGYIKREKILYGVAGIYRNTSMGKKLAGLPSAVQKIRTDQLKHDIAVLDTAIYFHKKYAVSFEDMKTEIELHRQDGFGVRKHRPDFTFNKDSLTVCVEVELTLKAKTRFENNIKKNFLDYTRQIWIVTSLNTKIVDILNNLKPIYSNIEIMKLSEVENYE